VGVCFSFVSPGVGKGKGKLTWNSMGMRGAHGGIGGLCDEYMLLSLPLVSSDVVREEVNFAAPELCDCFGARTLGVLQRPFRFVVAVDPRQKESSSNAGIFFMVCQHSASFLPELSIFLLHIHGGHRSQLRDRGVGIQSFNACTSTQDNMK